MPRTTKPEKPHEKDAEYMRKAYIYTAILLILGLIGGLLLADRIVAAEEQREADAVEQQEQQERETDRPVRD